MQLRKLAKESKRVRICVDDAVWTEALKVCLDNRIYVGDLVSEALRAFLHPEADREGIPKVLGLLSSMREEMRLGRDLNEETAAVLASFIHNWFYHTDERPEEEREFATAQGARRFRKFLVRLGLEASKQFDPFGVSRDHGVSRVVVKRAAEDDEAKNY